MIVLARSSTLDIPKVVRETTRLAVLGTTIAGSVAALLAWWAIPLVFGREFEGAIAPFALLVPGVVSLAVSYCISPILILEGRMRVAAGASFVSLLVMVALDLLLIPDLGLVGAALASTVAYSVLTLIQWLWIRKRQPLRFRELVPDATDLRRLVSSLVEWGSRVRA
jgi:O-antigen/teichoic acid export membrane protein